jgi:ATP-binding cassette subfamily F protein uup
MDGHGGAVVYPGGWSDYAAQRPDASVDGTRATASRGAERQVEKPVEATASSLTFTERKRLETLPDIIGRLEAEIAKLAEFLSDADLFQKEPVKFKKATEAMAERQQALAAAEEEWLALADRA